MSRGTNISKLLISLRPIIACAKPVLVLSNQMSKIWAQPCYPPGGGGGWEFLVGVFLIQTKKCNFPYLFAD